MRAEDVLRQAGGRAGHIFNLGHGILQETPVEKHGRRFVKLCGNSSGGVEESGTEDEDMDAAIKLLEAKGAPPSQCAAWDGPKGKGRAVYVDTDPHGGVTLELIWNQKMPK